MIRYRLRCAKTHEFEAWFRNSADYDRQARRGLVACPDCASTKVEKALMAPSVSTRKAARPAVSAPVPAPAEGAAGEVVNVASDAHRQMREVARRIRAEVEAKAEYVGQRFAEEARKIHEAEESRGIYGEASADEVAALHEDGIEVFPLPRVPDSQN